MLKSLVLSDNERDLWVTLLALWVHCCGCERDDILSFSKNAVKCTN